MVQILNGIPVNVERVNTEKNRLAAANNANEENCKLAVTGLHPDINESDLRGLFSPFGEIENINVPLDDFGRSKGNAYIMFVNPKDSRKAFMKLNKFELKGKAVNFLFYVL